MNDSICDITVTSKRGHLLCVLWAQKNQVSLMLANTGSCEATVIFYDLIVRLAVGATHNEIRISLIESSLEIYC